ncbi:PEPxxWA-CTERM sorting domain-containing protein [uncultured Sphingomonas sp.]|uniref:PEPxxWA-CTERM sorting domain-containing protein n=1 Tax=uncultured Sphingomonas sp. TaxID=158754 RepID=UPI0025F6504B|nr:PEPxxWA-CTERM sorting domain-containing protein [uncultured Sphingomonas sp.]
MKKILLALTSVGALASTAAPASAALIEKNFVVTGRDASGPFSTLNFNFNIVFDNSGDIATTKNGLTVFETLPGYSLSYAYEASSDLLSVGTFVGVNSITLDSTKNDLGFFLKAASTSDTSVLGGIDYTASTPPNFFSARSVTVVSTDLTAAVPEPGTWALMILGFGAVGYSMRRKKAVVRFA